MQQQPWKDPLLQFALITIKGVFFAVFTALSVKIVGIAVALLLGPSDWFCRAIQTVSHYSAFFTFVFHVVRDFLDLFRK